MKKIFLTVFILIAGIALARSIELEPTPEPELEKIMILDKEYSQIEYDQLKMDMATVIFHRKKIKPSWNEKEQWIAIVNKELKNCELTNITEKNLIDKLNECVK